MPNKLAALINNLSAEDLVLLKKDFDEGNLRRLLEERMREMPQKVCPVCNAEVDENAPFVLVFGTDIRQKARFDAQDCLEHFLRVLKDDR